MSTAEMSSNPALLVGSDIVASDFSALALHMSACERSQGRFMPLRRTLERVQAFASPRIVTTSAVVAVCLLGLFGLG